MNARPELRLNIDLYDALDEVVPREVDTNEGLVTWIIQLKAAADALVSSIDSENFVPRYVQRRADHYRKVRDGKT